MTDLGYSIYEQTFNSLGDDSYDHPAAKKGPRFWFHGTGQRDPGGGVCPGVAGSGMGGEHVPGGTAWSRPRLRIYFEEANHMPNRVIRDSILTSRRWRGWTGFSYQAEGRNLLLPFVRRFWGCDDTGGITGPQTSSAAESVESTRKRRGCEIFSCAACVSSLPGGAGRKLQELAARGFPPGVPGGLPEGPGERLPPGEKAAAGEL